MGQELEWNYKREQSGPLGKFYCKYFHAIVSEFYLNGFSMNS